PSAEEDMPLGVVAPDTSQREREPDEDESGPEQCGRERAEEGDLRRLPLHAEQPPEVVGIGADVRLATQMCRDILDVHSQLERRRNQVGKAGEQREGGGCQSSAQGLFRTGPAPERDQEQWGEDERLWLEHDGNTEEEASRRPTPLLG